MKIQANISISRDSNDVMRVRVEDEASRATFLEMEFSLEDFMRALTGLGHTYAKTAEVHHLEIVGKKKISERRRIAYQGDEFDSKEEMANWLKEGGKEAGWQIDTYLGSQGSVSRVDDQTFLNYRVFRYETVDADQPA